MTTAALEDGGTVCGLPGDGDEIDPEWRLYARGTGDDRAPTSRCTASPRCWAPLVIVPIANHDDNQHAPDENLRIGNLLDGVVTMASLRTS